MAKNYDVIVVGAGAAGIGIGVILRHLGVLNFTLLDRYEIGASFLRWPQEMRFITPSFASNGFGLMDLNAVAIATSPAHTLSREHPNGREYAHYLQSVARYFEVPVQEGIDVQHVEKRGDGFYLTTSEGELRSHFLIWAAGEFQYPHLQPFPGSEYCLHNATVTSWRSFIEEEYTGEEYTVIGGYESGIDAAVNLVRLGKRVRMMDEDEPWLLEQVDPSFGLSPYTRVRLQKARQEGQLTLMPSSIASIDKEDRGYTLRCTDGEMLHSPTAPILATGFAGSVSLIHDLFDWHPEAYYPLLTTDDESTKTSGLFLTGPMVRHGNLIFCFIYKFRQRFAVVAKAIGDRLDLDTTCLEEYRAHQMYLDDLTCCTAEGCAC